MKEILKDRENALEYEFFHKVDEQLWQQLKDKLKCEKRQQALTDATGITDDAVLAELVELDISCETIFALSLFPLVWVAWADGKVAEKERQAILESAHSSGHERDTASHHLIETWLEHEPSEEIRMAWKDYVQAICHTISPVAQQTLKRDVLERARQVAKTAGGFLGFHKISHAQETTLLEVEKAFDDRATKGDSR